MTRSGPAARLGYLQERTSGSRSSVGYYPILFFIFFL